MSTFLTAALSAPTVVFTVLIGFFLIYAALTLLGALDMDQLDSVFDFDSSGGDWLAGIPIAVVIGVSSVFAWMLSFGAMRFLPDTVLVQIGAGIGSAAIGLGLGLRAVRPFRSLFTTAKGPHRKELVGKICTIRSLRVTESSGTADVGDLVAEVRCFRDNELTLGSKAIVYDYDSKEGTYHVGPIDPSIVC